MEVVLKYIQFHRFVNRGFLIGPYCPIYGAGVVLVTVMVDTIASVEHSVGTTFLISFIGCGAIEYFVSYYMEKRFHARWWDYSKKPMNLHGRVWIGNLILFGIGGTLVNEVLNPILFSLFAKIPEMVLYILAGLIVATMSADYLVSHFIMKFVKTGVEGSKADNTEAVSKEIKLLLSNKTILYKRIADAYPDVIYRTDRINRRMNEVKEELERIRRERTEHWDEWKQEVAYKLELLEVTPSQIQEEIIGKQDQLIAALQTGSATEEELLSLQKEIQEKKETLEERSKMSRW